MKLENYERAKSIESEIALVREDIDAVRKRSIVKDKESGEETRFESARLHLSANGRSTYQLANDFLPFPLESIVDFYLIKAEDHIKTLEKEFESL